MFLERVSRLVTKRKKVEIPQTVSIEEYNKVKQALEEANNKITSLTEMKENKKDRNTLEEGFRYDMIRHLHEGIYFKNDQDRKESIESFAKSKMIFEEITWHLNLVRSLRSEINTTTKLPQKSTSESFIK